MNSVLQLECFFFSKFFYFSSSFFCKSLLRLLLLLVLFVNKLLVNRLPRPVPLTTNKKVRRFLKLAHIWIDALASAYCILKNKLINSRVVGATRMRIERGFKLKVCRGKKQKTSQLLSGFILIHCENEFFFFLERKRERNLFHN